MKKKFFVIAAVCAAAFSLVGCDFGGNSGNGGNGNNGGSSASRYEALNQMLHASYSEIVLTVTDTFDANTALTSTYQMSYAADTITVNYTVERFAELSLDGSESLKTTLTGEAVIKDGAVVSVNGDSVDLSAAIASTGFVFWESYFSNVVLTDTYLQADVTNVGGFMGSLISCTDMKVTATFFDVFIDLTITYTSASGSNVEYQYAFAR